MERDFEVSGAADGDTPLEGTPSWELRFAAHCFEVKHFQSDEVLTSQ